MKKDDIHLISHIDDYELLKLAYASSTYDEFRMNCDLHMVPCDVSRDTFEEMMRPKHYYWNDLVTHVQDNQHVTIATSND